MDNIKQEGNGQDAVTLESMIRAAIAKKTPAKDNPTANNQAGEETPDTKSQLPRIVTFPYSRHSSYPELCHLLSIFKPKDVWPCTVNEDTWLENGKC